MKDQLLRIMETEGMTPAKFADEIGVQRSSISHILSGRNKPSYDFIVKILERFQGINADWLISGTGSMIKSSGSAAVGSIKQASLFDQPQKIENKTTIKKIKPLQDRSEFNDSNDKSGNDKSDLKLKDKDIFNKIKEQFTNVNDINYIVIFFEDGTFKQYLQRK
jgi:transcriptional regulator with XRE-family HTH domain